MQLVSHRSTYRCGNSKLYPMYAQLGGRGVAVLFASGNSSCISGIVGPGIDLGMPCVEFVPQ